MSEDKHFKNIKRALVSVYHKEPIRELITSLHALGIEIMSTGGTAGYIASMGIPVTTVESLTTYPSILGGRVKTLHPVIFGGILARRDDLTDDEQLKKFGISPIDLVVVDLYPFSEAAEQGRSHEEIIEQIDIGGVSLIRAAAKNYQDVVVLPCKAFYGWFLDVLKENNGATSLDERKKLASEAFNLTTAYDMAICQYLEGGNPTSFASHISGTMSLRYGENPHQQGRYFGALEELMEQIQGKALSYNNLLDIDAALGLIAEFEEPAIAIIKHTNPCGVATGNDMLQIWRDALSGDPVSAFGGIIVSNRMVTEELALAIDEIFFEALLAPGFDIGSRQVFSAKKNRIILETKQTLKRFYRFHGLLNGVLWQTEDIGMAAPGEWEAVTEHRASKQEETDLRLANLIVKHLKSNAIALVRDGKLIGMGAGQTSRVDALVQAIKKARDFGHDMHGAVMASDAFFPFPDCVEIADEHGIRAVIQPGGSVKDKESVAYCNKAGMSMVMTGRRHFRH